MRNESLPEETLEKLSYNMRVLRVCNGWSSKEASEKAGLHQVKRWEAIEYGRGTPNLKEVLSICKALSQPIDDMLNKKVHVTFEFRSV